MLIKISNNTKEKLKWQLLDLMYIAISIVLALVVGGIFMAILGCDPIEGYWIIFSKAFSSFGQVLRRSTVYILTGLAVAIPIKTGAFNMGGEGQVAAGALAAAVIGSAIALPMGIHPVVCMLGALVVGGVLAFISAFMKVKFGSSEVVTGIMVNYIVMYVIQYLSMYTFRGSANSAQTAEVFETAKIARAYPGSQWSYGLFISIGLCLFFAFMINRTRLGLEMKSAGLNPLASRYQGVNTKTMSVLAMVIGGAMAGLGGAVEVLGGRYLYLDTYFASFGYDGIAVSYMAANNPIGVIITAFIISVLKVGAVALDRQTNVSIHYITALQGLIITLLVSPYLVRAVLERLRRRKREAELVANEM